MKSTRKAFLASLGAVFVTAGAAFAARGGNGGGRGGAKKKVVVNGKITSVDAEAQTFVLHRNGGRGNGRNGSDVTVAYDPETTVFIRSDDTDGSPLDLAVGVKAQAKGKLVEGVLEATRVLIKVEEEEETEE